MSFEDYQGEFIRLAGAIDIDPVHLAAEIERTEQVIYASFAVFAARKQN